MRIFSVVLSVAGVAGGIWAGSARAAECGKPSPAYKANRTVTIGDHVARSVVYVSGPNMREEVDLNSHLLVTLLLAQSGFTTKFDMVTKQGVKLPVPPPPPNRPQTRQVEEKDAAGAVFHNQFESNGRWIELSATRCNADDIMTSQTFTSFDPQGQLVEVHVRQDGIVAGPVDASMFEVPSYVTIKQP